jgi:hypothetical protein
MSNKKQTVVEWLVAELRKYGSPVPRQYEDQAKEMFEKQIIDAYDSKVIETLANEYYNETFNKQSNVVEFTKPINDIYDEALQSFKRYQELMYSKTNQCNNETFNSEENENN